MGSHEGRAQGAPARGDLLHEGFAQRGFARGFLHKCFSQGVLHKDHVQGKYCTRAFHKGISCTRASRKGAFHTGSLHEGPCVRVSREGFAQGLCTREVLHEGIFPWCPAHRPSHEEPGSGGFPEGASVFFARGFRCARGLTPGWTR